MIRLSFVYVLCIYFTSVSCDCTRGFEEHDRSFINIITNVNIQRGKDILPFWFKQGINGGNLVIDRLDRTSIVVPASGTYAIFISVEGVSGSRVRAFRQGQRGRDLIVQQPVNSLGTTICGSVLFLEINDRVNFLIEKGEPTDRVSLQLFAYLINLSNG